MCLRSCIHTYTDRRKKKKKVPKDCEIKTPNSRFHLTLFRIFPSRCLPLQAELLCILFCNRLSLLICLGHCLPCYHRPGELSPQIRILPSVGFHSSGEPLSRSDVSLQRAPCRHSARSPGHVANLEEMEIKRADVR